MNFSYDLAVIRLAQNTNKMVYEHGDELGNTSESQKEVKALKRAITAVSLLFKKPFGEVYEDVSEAAACYAIKDCLECLDLEFNEQPLPVAVNV